MPFATVPPGLLTSRQANPTVSWNVASLDRNRMSLVQVRNVCLIMLVSMILLKFRHRSTIVGVELMLDIVLKEGKEWREISAWRLRSLDGIGISLKPFGVDVAASGKI